MSENNSTERKIPEMISAFAYESAMEHRDEDSKRLSDECERMHKLVNKLIFVIKVLVAVLVVLTITFVATYTIRTRYWLNTFERFATSTVAEVQNAGIHGQADQ